MRQHSNQYSPGDVKVQACVVFQTTDIYIFYFSLDLCMQNGKNILIFWLFRRENFQPCLLYLGQHTDILICDKSIFPPIFQAPIFFITQRIIYCTEEQKLNGIDFVSCRKYSSQNTCKQNEQFLPYVSCRPLTFSLIPG